MADTQTAAPQKTATKPAKKAEKKYVNSFLAWGLVIGAFAIAIGVALIILL